MNIKMTFVTLIGLSILITGCKTYERNITYHGKKVKALLVLPSSASIEVGEEQQFQATLIYTDDSREKVTSEVQWISSNTTDATISSQSGASSGEAQGVGVGTSTITAQLLDIRSIPAKLSVSTIHTLSRFAYITNYDTNTVSACLINNTDGTFASPCQSVGQSGGHTFSNPWAIALNPAGTFAYIGNYTANTISVCPIVKTTGLFGTCQDTQISNIVEDPDFQINAIAFDDNPSAGDQLYIGSSKSTLLWSCGINKQGAISTCSNVNTWAEKSQYIGRTLSGTSTYISSSLAPDNIARCTYDTQDCTSGYLASYSQGIAIHAKETYAYYAELGGVSPKTIQYCPISTTTGMFTTCTTAVPDLSWVPAAIAFKQSSANFYVTNQNAGGVNGYGVYYCTADGTGGSTPQAPNCVLAGTGFHNPLGIAITP